MNPINHTFTDVSHTASFTVPLLMLQLFAEYAE
uniref:Uncharacterized protein n=1 Tax=Anguilla anguilla TaxID=7936 RepID=A0A0E9PXJ4_ANGAN